MKHPRLLHAFLAVAVSCTLPVQGASDPDFKTIAPSVAELMEKAHYSRRKLDDSVSRELFKNYIDGLDYNHLFFTQKDVDNLSEKYATTLDDHLLSGNVAPAMEIFAVYKKRVEERVAKNKELAEKEFKFDTDRTVELNRQKAEWAKDDEAADQLWADRIEAEMLDRLLMEDKAADPPAKVLTKRYNQLLRNVRELEEEDVISNFLSMLAQTYDPHSEYMSRSQLASFKINMQLSLVGIGAVLVSEDGYAKIRELMPGGPAADDGRMKVGDRICGVAQGDAEFVETLDLKLDKVVEMIRGKKDTVVRLQILPADAVDPSVRKIIDIKRREVKLKEQEAKAQLVERPLPNGGTQRLGWITLPSFYADMDKGTKSTTKDVLALLERLKKENIEGLVVDLRRDGGGSLDEAVKLTGLFIKSGPVVVAKDSNGKPNILKDRDKTVAYDGPLIVLCNRLSASASEIFAAALQDYNRAVIVGDSSTFGKGTVQTMVDIGRILPISLSGKDDAGALKLTIQKFYRIAGGSTQLKGVMSDIHLPSMYDQPEIGESALKGPMPYDTIEPTPFSKLDQPLYLEQLSKRSKERVANNQEFRWIKEDNERSKKRMDENRISLNEQSRRTEMTEEKAEKEARKADLAKHKPLEEKVYTITLDNAGEEGLELLAEKEEKKDEGTAGEEPKKDEKPKSSAEDAKDDDEETDSIKFPKLDTIRNEALHILTDMIDFARKPPAAEDNKPTNTAAK